MNIVQTAVFPRPGSRVCVERGAYQHEFIASAHWHNGAPLGITFERDGLLLKPWHSLVKENSWVADYPSDLSCLDVLNRACTFPGRYNLLSKNCQHHVRYAHGLPEESPQVTRYVVGAVAAVGIALLLNK